MEIIGKNIERLQELTQTLLDPPPSWIRSWQTEAEHLLFLAHNAKDVNDLEELKKLDKEADRMVKSRTERMKSN